MAHKTDTAYPGGRKRRRKLRNVNQARQLVASVLQEVEMVHDKSEPEIARLLIYGAQVLAQLIDGASVENRIKALEEKVENGWAGSTQ